MFLQQILELMIEIQSVTDDPLVNEAKFTFSDSKTVLKALDADNNGEVSASEFINWLSKGLSMDGDQFEKYMRSGPTQHQLAMFLLGVKLYCEIEYETGVPTVQTPVAAESEESSETGTGAPSEVAVPVGEGGGVDGGADVAENNAAVKIQAIQRGNKKRAELVEATASETDTTTAENAKQQEETTLPTDEEVALVGGESVTEDVLDTTEDLWGAEGESVVAGDDAEETKPLVEEKEGENSDVTAE